MHVNPWAQNLAQAGGEEPEVTTALLLFGVGAVLFGAYFLRRVGVAQWRGEFTRISDFWGRIWGPRWEKAAKAAYPYVFIGMISLGAPLILGYFQQVTTGTLSDVLSVLSEVSIGIFFIVFALLASILIVNRPRFLVPPHARDFHGVLGDWVISAVKRLRHRRKRTVRHEGGPD